MRKPPYIASKYVAAVQTTVAAGLAPEYPLFTPNGAEIWVPETTSNKIGIFTRAGVNLLDVNTAAVPLSLAFDRFGVNGYCPCFGGDEVTVVNALTRAVSHLPMAAGSNPADCIVSPDSQYLWVGLTSLAEVVRVKLSDSSVTHVACAGSSAWAVAITPNGATVLMSDYNGGIWDIDTTSLVATKTATPLGTSDIIISPDGKTAYVTNNIDFNVRTYDLATRAVGTIAIGQTSNAVAVTADGTLIFVTCFATNIKRIVAQTHGVADIVLPGSTPFGVAADPLGLLTPVCDATANTLILLNNLAAPA